MKKILNKQERLYLDELSWGGALSGAGKGAAAGAAVGSVFPVVGTAIGAAAGAVIGGVAGHFSEESKNKALEQKENSIKADMARKQFQADNYGDASGVWHSRMMYADGGQIGNPGMDIINDYTGQKHEGPNRGIDVDKNGAPTSMNGRPPVAKTEGGEISYNGYVFSNRLKSDNGKTFAESAKRIMSKYKRRLGDRFDKIDKLSSDAMKRELEPLMKENEEVKATIQQSIDSKLRMFGGPFEDFDSDESFSPSGSDNSSNENKSGNEFNSEAFGNTISGVSSGLGYLGGLGEQYMNDKFAQKNMELDLLAQKSSEDRMYAPGGPLPDNPPNYAATEPIYGSATLLDKITGRGDVKYKPDIFGNTPNSLNQLFGLTGSPLNSLANYGTTAIQPWKDNYLNDLHNAMMEMIPFTGQSEENVKNIMANPTKENVDTAINLMSIHGTNGLASTVLNKWLPKLAPLFTKVKQPTIEPTILPQTPAVVRTSSQTGLKRINPTQQQYGLTEGSGLGLPEAPGTSIMPRNNFTGIEPVRGNYWEGFGQNRGVKYPGGDVGPVWRTAPKQLDPPFTPWTEVTTEAFQTMPKPPIRTQGVPLWTSPIYTNEKAQNVEGLNFQPPTEPGMKEGREDIKVTQLENRGDSNLNTLQQQYTPDIPEYVWTGENPSNQQSSTTPTIPEKERVPFEHKDNYLGFIPGAVNMARGIFDKPDKINESEYMLSRRVTPRQYSTREAEKQAETAAYNRLRAYNPSSPSANAAQRIASDVAMQDQVSRIKEQGFNINEQLAQRAEEMNLNIDQMNNQTRMGIMDINDRNRAAQEQLLTTGLGQTVDASKIMSQERSTAELIDKMYPTWRDKVTKPPQTPTETKKTNSVSETIVPPKAEVTIPEKPADVDFSNSKEETLAPKTNEEYTQKEEEYKIHEGHNINKETGMHEVYADTTGNKTVGYGHKLSQDEIDSGKYDNGISEKQAEDLLNADIKKHSSELYSNYKWAQSAPDGVRTALEDMYFNMGGNNFASFKNTLELIKNGKYEEAANNIEKSKYAKQVGKRAKRNADLIRNAKTKQESNKSNVSNNVMNVKDIKSPKEIIEEYDKGKKYSDEDIYEMIKGFERRKK